MEKLISKITFWNMVFLGSLIMAIVAIFGTKNNDILIYHCLVMVMSYGFDRLEKLIKNSRN